MGTRTGLLIIGGSLAIALATWGGLVWLAPSADPKIDPYWACMETYGLHADDPAEDVDPDRVAEADAACR
jgi:hypothetical protein